MFRREDTIKIIEIAENYYKNNSSSLDLVMTSVFIMKSKAKFTETGFKPLEANVINRLPPFHVDYCRKKLNNLNLNLFVDDTCYFLFVSITEEGRNNIPIKNSTVRF